MRIEVTTGHGRRAPAGRTAAVALLRRWSVDGVGTGSDAQRLTRGHQRSTEYGARIKGGRHGGTVAGAGGFERGLEVADVIDDVLDDLELGQLLVLGHVWHEILEFGQVHLDFGVLAVAMARNASGGNVGRHGGTGGANSCDGLHGVCVVVFEGSSGDDESISNWAKIRFLLTRTKCGCVVY